MTITYEVTIESQNFWNINQESVIFVEKEEYIDIVHKYLVDQDNCWSDEKILIRVKPKKIGDMYVLTNLCSFCGYADIYDVNKFISDMKVQNIDVFIYQYNINI